MTKEQFKGWLKSIANNSVEGDEETEELIKYAKRHWGIVVT